MNKLSVVEDKDRTKFKPVPLPELGAQDLNNMYDGPFNATVKVLSFSKPKDPKTVDYQEALMQAKAVILTGPLAGQEVGLRHEVMHKGRLAKVFTKGGQPKILDQEINMRLVPWEAAVKEDQALGNHMVYDDTDIDLLAPILGARRATQSTQFATSLKVWM